MANGGMWPMRQSDRGGLLVSAIADAQADSIVDDAIARAKTNITTSMQHAPTALERAEAKIRAAGGRSMVELDTDELDALLTKQAAPAPEPKAATRSALATAADVVDHRRAAYGSPKENFQRIADFWSISMRDKLKPGETVSLADVAQMMRLVKEARLIETPDHFDSLVDICGYVDCQQQVL